MALKEEFRSNGNFLFKHRSYLPLVIIVAGLSVFVYSKVNFPFHSWDWIYDLGCVLISAFGLLIRVLAVGFSADNTSGRNTTSGQIADEINTTGLYSICRHPLYLGNFFMWLGIAMFTQNLWFIVAFTFLYWLYYERIMYAEESFLIKKYGSRYTDWAATLPAFVPNISKWRKPKYSFSWIKIIRQEKTGILNLFIMVFAFKSLGQYLSEGVWLNFESYWFWGLVVGIVWYVIIKTIQKSTNWLEHDRIRA